MFVVPRLADRWVARLCGRPVDSVEFNSVEMTHCNVSQATQSGYPDKIGPRTKQGNLPKRSPSVTNPACSTSLPYLSQGSLVLHPLVAHQSSRLNFKNKSHSDNCPSTFHGHRHRVRGAASSPAASEVSGCRNRCTADVDSLDQEWIDRGDRGQWDGLFRRKACVPSRPPGTSGLTASNVLRSA